MTNPTSNFGWQMPTSTDLVTDLPADFEVFGQAVDTSLADLKGGTTGQVLAKASNTNMDFTWVAQDDSNAIQNAIVDAKGDLIAATAADTPARLAVGTNGQLLSADSTAATGLAWTTIATGGMTVLATGTFSGATTTISSINQTYNDLRLVVRNLNPQTTGQNFRVQFNGVTSGYVMNSTGTVSNGGISATFVSGVGCDSGAGNAVIVVDALDYAFTGSWKQGRIVGFMPFNAGNTNMQNWAWGFSSTSAISSISMSMTSGNINGGTYILYGVK
jgi:hypothetical protein